MEYKLSSREKNDCKLNVVVVSLVVLYSFLVAFTFVNLQINNIGLKISKDVLILFCSCAVYGYGGLSFYRATLDFKQAAEYFNIEWN
jgi:hypothetical protein